MMNLLPSWISQWPSMLDFGWVRLTNICINQLRMLRILSSGGLLTIIFTWTFITWLWTILASLLSKIPIRICICLTIPQIAISTAVECVFSQGHQLSSFTFNCLSASSICAFLCLSSWHHHDLISFEDILVAVKEKSKRMWEESDSDVEVIE